MRLRIFKLGYRGKRNDRAEVEMQRRKRGSEIRRDCGAQFTELRKRAGGGRGNREEKRESRTLSVGNHEEPRVGGVKWPVVYI